MYGVICIIMYAFCFFLSFWAHLLHGLICVAEIPLLLCSITHEREPLIANLSNRCLRKNILAYFRAKWRLLYFDRKDLNQQSGRTLR